MAYAVKSYNNDKQYKKTEDRNVLDVIIKRFTKDATAPYVTRPEKKSFVDKSVQKLAVNSIIEGYFPKENLVKAMAIKRVNKMLCIAIGLLLTVVVVSYYFVLSCEMKLNDLSRQTIVLNNENEELENKLDSLKSFSNVDKTLQKNNMLQRAGKVIETPEVTVDSEEIIAKSKKKKVFNYAIGF
ncbi:MAG: hypothetical protein MJ231_03545 [bacterium]|nr:hypothetical protein [bacterium]